MVYGKHIIISCIPNLTPAYSFSYLLLSSIIQSLHNFLKSKVSIFIADIKKKKKIVKISYLCMNLTSAKIETAKGTLQLSGKVLLPCTSQLTE